MPRSVEATLPPDRVGGALERLKGLDGVVGLELRRGSSLKPPGDLLVVHATNDATRPVLEILAQSGAAGSDGALRTSEPRSLVSRPDQAKIDRESNETIWEEMAFLLRRDTNVSLNYLAAMALSGIIAAAGLWTDTIHVVVGAMVLAPGFEPILRIPFGVIGGPRILASRGFVSVLAGYGMLALAAALAYWVLAVIDPSRSPDLETREWVRYWSKVDALSVFVALVAGVSGAIVVTAQRSVLTVGVMIALALIPSMAIVGMALASGNLPLAVGGLARWGVEAAAVAAMGGVVLGLKQVALHRRQSLA